MSYTPTHLHLCARLLCLRHAISTTFLLTRVVAVNISLPPYIGIKHGVLNSYLSSHYKLIANVSLLNSAVCSVMTVCRSFAAVKMHCWHLAWLATVAVLAASADGTLVLSHG